MGPVVDVSLGRVLKQPGIKARRGGLVVTPLLEDWLQSKAGDKMGVEDDDDLALASRLLAASQDNSKRDGRFGASSRGTCHRAQIYGFLGLPRAQVIGYQLQNIFNDGTFRHIRWQLMLMKAGIVTDVEVPFKVPDWRLSTSLDAENDAHPWLLELKGVGGGKSITHVKNVEDIPQAHMLQMHTMLFATGWPLAIYIQEAKATNGWTEVLVPRDEAIINEVRVELDILNTAVEDKTIPHIQEACKRKQGDYKQCPYGALCLRHHSQDSPWLDNGRWEDDTGTSVQVERQR